jgi:chromosomal replication initiator protein
MHEHWQTVLAGMRAKLSKDSFETWLAPIGWGGAEGNTVRLCVPNRFYADWIRTHYQDVLLDMLTKSSGQSALALTWTIDEALGRSLPSRESAPAAAPSPRPAVQAAHGMSLKSGYRFETFVVGPSNQLAHAASLAAATKPGARYNPLFIYGGVGLGKTHLMNAIGQRLLDTRPSAHIVYTSAEEFTNEFIMAIRNRTMDEFRDKFRKRCDVLLLDDIQFLAGREQTMEEFFHTFNALYHSDRQIVVTSDVNLREITKLEERVISRFESGLVADIQAPDLATRIAIIQQKAAQNDIELPHDVTEYLAASVQDNVRTLEGLLVRMLVKAELVRRPIDLAFAREVLNGAERKTEPPTSVDDIQRMVCEHFGIRLSDLKGSGKQQTVTRARMIAMYLCRQRLKTTFTELGQRFGGKDHTTVMSAVKKIDARVAVADSDVLSSLRAIELRLKRG